MYGICIHSIIPLRSEPNDRAEIVSQIVFGDHYREIEIKEKWIKILNEFDQYEGWICHKQHNAVSDKTITHWLALEKASNSTLIVIKSGDENMTLSPGATLPSKEKTFEIGRQRFEISDNISLISKSEICSFAKTFLNIPYLWGGKSWFGIDCSGFTQTLFKCCGIMLPRDAYQQAEIGESVETINLSQPGDLCFFKNKEGKINHVGMVLHEQQIIHASGKVRIDMLDTNGIFNLESKTYSHSFHSIKRIF